MEMRSIHWNTLCVKPWFSKLVRVPHKKRKVKTRLEESWPFFNYLRTVAATNWQLVDYKSLLTIQFVFSKLWQFGEFNEISSLNEDPVLLQSSSKTKAFQTLNVPRFHRVFETMFLGCPKGHLRGRDLWMHPFFEKPNTNFDVILFEVKVEDPPN